MKSTKELKAQAEQRARAKLRHQLKVKAQREIGRLLKELRDETLDAKKLKSGLHKVREHLKWMPNHDQ